jgi:type VI protein secretion system component VasK
METGAGGRMESRNPERRPLRRVRPRRPWLLIAAALALALLSVVLWAKWRAMRERAVRLEAEIKQVYEETERLRTEAALARQRIGQLEQQLRALTAERERARNGSGASRALPRR